MLCVHPNSELRATSEHSEGSQIQELRAMVRRKWYVQRTTTSKERVSEKNINTVCYPNNWESMGQGTSLKMAVFKNCNKANFAW